MPFPIGRTIEGSLKERSPRPTLAPDGGRGARQKGALLDLGHRTSAWGIRTARRTAGQPLIARVIAVELGCDHIPASPSAATTRRLQTTRMALRHQGQWSTW